MNYEFASSPDRGLLSQETLPLQLLEITNRGVPRGDDQIRLRRAVHGELTVEDLAGDKLRFGNVVAIEGNRFVIHFS